MLKTMKLTNKNFFISKENQIKQTNDKVEKMLAKTSEFMKNKAKTTQVMKELYD